MKSRNARTCLGLIVFCLPMIFAATAAAASPALAALDTDGDGVLSIAEIGAIEPVIANVDKNKDGTLSAEELTGLLKGASPDRATAINRAIADVPKPDAAEKTIRTVLDNLDKNHRKGNLNVPVQDGQLLRLLIEAIGAKRAVEIGMSNGYSGIWTIAGLRRNDGKLTTFEIDEDRAAQARTNFKDAGVTDRVTIVMGDAHKNIKSLKGGIDFVFIDADKAGYIDYLNEMLPKVRKGGLIVAHNTKMDGVDKYIDAIQKSDQLDSVLIHQKGRGVAISIKK